MRLRAGLAATLVLVLPSAAFAHAGPGATHGVLRGFAHPVGGLDRILAMVAVGAFAFGLGACALWLVPTAFVEMMVASIALGVAQVPGPFVALGIALCSVVIGGAAALGRSRPVGAAMALVGVFALVHCHAQGAMGPRRRTASLLPRAS